MNVRSLSLVLWVYVYSTAAAYAQPTPELDLLLATTNSYRSNLEQFECYTYRYTVTRGHATSIANALSGKLESGARTANAVIHKRRGEARYRIDEDEVTKRELDAPPRKADMMRVNGMVWGQPVPFTTEDSLYGQGHRMTYDPRMATANVSKSRVDITRTPYYILSPLRAGRDDEYSALGRRVASGELKLAACTQSGNEVFSSFDLPNGIHVRYTVDAAKGALPTRLEMTYDHGKGGSSTTVVPRILGCSRNRYFPERILSAYQQDPAREFFIVTDYKVVDFEADECPSPDKLAVNLPAGTIVCQAEDSRKYFKTRQPESIDVGKLAVAYQMTEKAESTPLMDTAIPDPPSTRWYWYVFAGVFGLLLVGYLYRHQRRKRGADVTP